jgi:hypothetical protein
METSSAVLPADEHSDLDKFAANTRAPPLAHDPFACVGLRSRRWETNRVFR